MQAFRFTGEDIKVVESFTFLGEKIEKDGACGVKIKRCLTLVRAAMGSLSKIWKDKYIRQATKVPLILSLVFSIKYKVVQM